MLLQYITILFLGYFGGWIFSLLHIPIPWMLGPLVATCIMKYSFKRQFFWSSKIRNVAMAILGFVMGSPFSPETGQNIVEKLPILISITLATVVICLVCSFLANRHAGLNLATSLLGSMPGGMSQVITICEDIPHVNTAAVTLMQTVRMLTIVSFVPFIAMHGLSDVASPTWIKEVDETEDSFALIIFFIVICILIYLGNQFNIPSSYIICPILGTAILVLSGIQPPSLPPSVIALAQICMGIHMGMAINVDSITGWKKLCFYNWLSIISVLILLLLLNYLLSHLASMSLVTAFISTAPGGMTEMGVTAMMVKADLPTVVAFQLFRFLFVLLIAIPVVRWWLDCYEKRKND